MTEKPPTRSASELDPTLHDYPENPWPALWAMVIGFFMILVDTTIVQVATDAIMVDLDSDLNGVVWVTSAYLLAYVIPLLLSGRLGDRFGPKPMFLLGLALFTIASTWCGFADSIPMLVAARVVQGLGASLITPQTMAVITRTFPPHKRGSAMALWGSVAGVALLVGPLAGGFLVDAGGWSWIFFVNVPVGIIALVAAWRLVPDLPLHEHRFDIPGIVLSAVGLFLLVFGIQEGQKHDWGTIVGPISVWSLIIAGVVLLVAFVWWQSRAPEPLMTLSLFRDRNFSLANIAIATMGFAVTGMGIPLMLYAQKTMGLSPMRSALLFLPVALLSIALAAPAGSLTDKLHPRIVASFGLLVSSIGLFWLGAVANATTPVWQLVLPLSLVGIGSPFVWGPLSATANRNLPLAQAGAGSGVYNMTRQVGAVVGSAAVGVLMQNRIVAHLSDVAPAGPGAGSDPTAVQSAPGVLPDVLREPFAQAMGQSVYLPAAALLLGVAATLCFATPRHLERGRPEGASAR